MKNCHRDYIGFDFYFLHIIIRVMIFQCSVIEFHGSFQTSQHRVWYFALLPLVFGSLFISSALTLVYMYTCWPSSLLLPLKNRKMRTCASFGLVRRQLPLLILVGFWFNRKRSLQDLWERFLPADTHAETDLGIIGVVILRLLIARFNLQML